MSTWALVPAKSFARAKSRLAGVLGERERAALAQAMLEHVLGVLAACPAIGGVVVVTDGDDVAELSRARGADVMRDGASPPLGAIVDEALTALSRRSDRALVLMSDLPLLAVSDVKGLVEKMERADVVAAPDERGMGCNALGISLLYRICTAFGEPDSFRLNLNRAARVQLVFTIHESEGLAFDVDEPADLARVPRAMY